MDLKKSDIYYKKMQINLLSLMDEAKCYELLRQIRWADGLYYLHCQSEDVDQNGHDENHPSNQRYQCNARHRNFDDLTDTFFSGSNESLKVWIHFKLFWLLI